MSVVLTRPASVPEHTMQPGASVEAYGAQDDDSANAVPLAAVQPLADVDGLDPGASVAAYDR